MGDIRHCEVHALFFVLPWHDWSKSWQICTRINCTAAAVLRSFII